MSSALPAARALALIALLALPAGCGTRATTTPAPRPQASTHTTVTLNVNALRVGAPPKIGWVNGRDVHVGKRIATLSNEFNDVLVTKVGRIVTTTYSDTGTALTLHDATGKATISFPIGNGRPVLNAERDVIGWVDSDLEPQVLADSSTKPIRLAKPPGAEGGAESIGEAVALIGQGCPGSGTEARTQACSLYLNWHHDPNSEALVAIVGGSIGPAGPPPIHQLFDVSRTGAMVGDDGSGVEFPIARYQPAGDGPSVVLKDFLPQSFSPDAEGKFILGMPPIHAEGVYADALIVVSAADGKPVVTARSPAGTPNIAQTAWEDDDHVLAVLNVDPEASGSMAIVRVGLDGHAELAVPATGTAPLALAIQP